MDGLVRVGLSEEEAYLVAAHRLGAPPELAAEYGKVNGGLRWARRLFWMLAGYVGLGLLFQTVASLGQWVSAGFLVSGLADTVGIRVLLRVVVPVLLLMPVVVLASTTDGRRRLADAADALVQWARGRPGVLLGLVIGLYIVNMIARTGGTVLQARLVDATTFGLEAYYLNCVRLVVGVLIPACVLGLLAWTYRRTRAAG
jgi:hypothetical protein